MKPGIKKLEPKLRFILKQSKVVLTANVIKLT